MRALPHLAVGHWDDPGVGVMIDRLSSMLAQAGADATFAVNYCRLRRTRLAARVFKIHPVPMEHIFAVPPQRYWPNVVALALWAWGPTVRRAYYPVRIVNGYRPKAYNIAVNGAPSSRHMHAAAFDAMPLKTSEIDGETWRARLADFRGLAIDTVHRWDGEVGKYGLGLYRSKVHMDFGVRRHRGLWGPRRPEYFAPHNRRPLVASLPRSKDGLELWTPGG